MYIAQSVKHTGHPDGLPQTRVSIVIRTKEALWSDKRLTEVLRTRMQRMAEHVAKATLRTSDELQASHGYHNCEVQGIMPYDINGTQDHILHMIHTFMHEPLRKQHFEDFEVRMIEERHQTVTYSVKS